MDEALSEVDQSLGMLFNGLRDRDIYDEINIIVTADHGMAQTSSERVILLDDYINLDVVEVVDWSPIASILPEIGCKDSFYYFSSPLVFSLSRNPLTSKGKKKSTEISHRDPSTFEFIREMVPTFLQSAIIIEIIAESHPFLWKRTLAFPSLQGKTMRATQKDSMVPHFLPITS